MTHDHRPAAPGGHRGRLAVALGLALTVLVVETVVALITGSLALLADAAHMLSDTFGLALALVAVTIARRPASDRRTYGYHRTEVLAAGVNGLILTAMCGFIAVTAIRRFGSAPELDATLVLGAGFLGLVANLAGLILLRTGAKENINIRGAYLEVLGDALGSVAVIISALLILTLDWHLADPLASLIIAGMILPRAWSLLRDVTRVLLESAPADLDMAEVRAHLLGVEGVVDVHDVHVWSITSGMPVMSAHVVVDESVDAMTDAHAVLDRLGECLRDHFDVDHSTFQIEPRGHVESHSHS